MSYYSREELRLLGLAQVGQHVQISKKASIYNPSRITIGSHVRIDDYCVLSAGEGGIAIGDYVHVAVFCSLIGGGRIVLEDFAGLSGRVSIYSSNEDYSGAFLTNPTVPRQFTHVTQEGVIVGRHCIIGAGAVVLPGVVLEEGVAIGALSLVNRSCSAFGIYAGVPARFVRNRSRKLRELGEQLQRETRPPDAQISEQDVPT